MRFGDILLDRQKKIRAGRHEGEDAADQLRRHQLQKKVLFRQHRGEIRPPPGQPARDTGQREDVERAAAQDTRPRVHDDVSGGREEAFQRVHAVQIHDMEGGPRHGRRGGLPQRRREGREDAPPDRREIHRDGRLREQEEVLHRDDVRRQGEREASEQDGAAVREPQQAEGEDKRASEGTLQGRHRRGDVRVGRPSDLHPELQGRHKGLQNEVRAGQIPRLPRHQGGIAGRPR